MTDDIAEGLGLSQHPGRAGRRRDAGRPGGQGGLGRMAIWSPASTASRSPIRAACRASSPTRRSARPSTVDVLRKGRKRACASRSPSWTKDRPTSRRKRAARRPPKPQVQAVAAGPVARRRWTAPARAKFKIARQCAGRAGERCRSRQPGRRQEFPSRRCDRGSAEPEGENARDEVESRVDADVKAGRKVELMLVNRGGDPTYVGLRLDCTRRRGAWHGYPGHLFLPAQARPRSGSAAPDGRPCAPAAQA